jgi:hypothetical protein
MTSTIDIISYLSNEPFLLESRALNIFSDISFCLAGFVSANHKIEFFRVTAAPIVSLIKNYYKNNELSLKLSLKELEFPKRVQRCFQPSDTVTSSRGPPTDAA